MTGLACEAKARRVARLAVGDLATRGVALEARFERLQRGFQHVVEVVEGGARVAQALGEAGFKVELEVLEWNALVAAWRAGAWPTPALSTLPI